MLRAESGGALKRTRIQLDPAASDASAATSSAARHGSGTGAHAAGIQADDLSVPSLDDAIFN